MSNIEWTQETWNPLAGCSKVSPGCANCYAEVMAHRLEKMGMTKYQGLTVLQGKHPRWTGKIAFDEVALLKPLKRKKPTTYFVNSMSDLFHENATRDQIDSIFAIMAMCPQHTFQVLTKRPERMREYFDWISAEKDKQAWVNAAYNLNPDLSGSVVADIEDSEYPLKNVWLGTSVERQEEADERIPELLQTPATVRFISAEPLLGSLRLKSICWQTQGSGGPAYVDVLGGHFCTVGGWGLTGPRLDWVIVGGESGYGSRECDVQWIRTVVHQCQDAKVPVFVKQMGMKPYVGKPGNRLKQMDKKKGGWMESWPEDLRVRQMPAVSR